MPDIDKRRKIIKALNHDFRKKILERVSAGKVTYTELLQLTGVESGYLAYHLKSMSDLLNKEEDGYTLSTLGVEAYTVLHGHIETPRSPISLPRITVIALLVVILVSTLYFAYSDNVNKSVEERRSLNRLTLSNHTIEMMDVIVNAFEYVDLPRSTWTDILIHSTLLHQDLKIMQADNDPLTSTLLIQNIDELMREATNTLSSSDASYLALSRENRQLLRDIYSELFNLKKELS